MKLLLLADLHNRRDWYDWIAGQSPSFDIVAVGGDLMDGFSPDGLLPQMEFVRIWTMKITAGGSCLALASGNHDIAPDWPQNTSGLWFQRQKHRRLAAFAKAGHWMDVLAQPGRVVVDGTTDILETGNGEKIVITSIPWEASAEKELWETGAQAREQYRCPWLVLNHEPPGGTMVGGTRGSFSLFYLILEFHPTFVLSGHLHDRPYRKDGSFAENLEGTWCFNPGHPARRGTDAPNCIMLDTVTGIVEWRGYEMGDGRWLKQKISLR
ncbi:metallophosphoesterase [soil metagenome]